MSIEGRMGNKWVVISMHLEMIWHSSMTADIVLREGCFFSTQKWTGKNIMPHEK